MFKHSGSCRFLFYVYVFDLMSSRKITFYKKYYWCAFVLKFEKCLEMMKNLDHLLKKPPPEWFLIIQLPQKKGWWASTLHRLSALSGFTDILKQQWDDSPTSNKCMFSTKSVSSLWMFSSCMLYLCTIIVAVASLSSARVDSWAVMPLSATCRYILYIFVLTF